jgi:hypothetical protein
LQGYINAQNFRHHKMAEILITTAFAVVDNYAGEYNGVTAAIHKSEQGGLSWQKLTR